MAKPHDIQSIEDLSLIIEMQQEIATAETGLDELMELVCLRAQKLTNAAGAVVEMVEDDEMVYRACTGSAASSWGVRLKINASLSGLSVRLNEVLHCTDSESDPRVDRVACRRVGARSMICVPLLHHSKIVGVLKVMSPEANIFSERDVRALRLTAGLLSACITQAVATSERQAALLSLQESETKFRTLIEYAHDGIVISAEGTILEANPAFCKLVGYEISELVGTSLLNMVAEEQRPITTANIKAGFDKPYESVLIRKDGSTVVVEGTGKTILLGGRNIRMTTLHDITERKQTETELRQSERKSRESAQLKSAFLANMSHEIRTPINGIMGMVDLLLDSETDPQKREYSEILKKSAEDLLVLVNDILDFSKIEAKKLNLEKIDFDLWEAVEGVRKTMAISAEKKNLGMRLERVGQFQAGVIGDPTRFRQVLSNLVSNAIKFTQAGSIVIRVQQIQADESESQFRVEVEDTGIGIPSQAMQHMFQPFSQVDASTTRLFGGTGLGLSICRELVQIMNGHIGVSSQEGKGSTFWFTVKLPVSKKVGVRFVPEATSGPISQRLRILVVDDHQINQLIASRMVEKMGHIAIIATNGFEALDSLKTASFDLVLMDCQMPKMDGYETTRRIRQSHEKWAQIPIVAMTASAMEGDREKCFQAGMNDYISKPARFEELIAGIERTMKAPRRPA